MIVRYECMLRKHKRKPHHNLSRCASLQSLIQRLKEEIADIWGVIEYLMIKIRGGRRRINRRAVRERKGLWKVAELANGGCGTKALVVERKADRVANICGLE